MKKLIALGLIAISMAMTGTSFAASYEVVKRFHQSAAPNREEADITVIRCSTGKEYYIYGYYRSSGPRYRTIIPPYWGNPLGGGDHYTFEDAIAAAC